MIPMSEQKVLALVTDDEAERFKRGMAKLDEALKVLDDADALAKRLVAEAETIKEEWQTEMRCKYEIGELDIWFDPEKGAIVEMSSDTALIVKVIELMARRGRG